MPVYNPFFIKIVHSILTITCLKCFRLQLSDHTKSIVELQLKLVDAGYIIEAQELEEFKTEAAGIAAAEKAEDDESVHPKIAHCYELLQKGNFHLTGYKEISLSIHRFTLQIHSIITT